MCQNTKSRREEEHHQNENSEHSVPLLEVEPALGALRRGHAVTTLKEVVAWMAENCYCKGQSPLHNLTAFLQSSHSFSQESQALLFLLSSRRSSLLSQPGAPHQLILQHSLLLCL